MSQIDQINNVQQVIVALDSIFENAEDFLTSQQGETIYNALRSFRIMLHPDYTNNLPTPNLFYDSEPEEEPDDEDEDEEHEEEFDEEPDEEHDEEPNWAEYTMPDLISWLNINRPEDFDINNFQMNFSRLVNHNVEQAFYYIEDTNQEYRHDAIVDYLARVMLSLGDAMEEIDDEPEPEPLAEEHFEQAEFSCCCCLMDYPANESKTIICCKGENRNFICNTCYTRNHQAVGKCPLCRAQNMKVNQCK